MPVTEVPQMCIWMLLLTQEVAVVAVPETWLVVPAALDTA
jgi:hypothetical protein